MGLVLAAKPQLLNQAAARAGAGARAWAAGAAAGSRASALAVPQSPGRTARGGPGPAGAGAACVALGLHASNALFLLLAAKGGRPRLSHLPALWLLLLLGRGRNDETCERFLKFPGGCSLLLGQPSAAFPQCRVQNDAFIKKDEVLGLS